MYAKVMKSNPEGINQYTVGREKETIPDGDGITRATSGWGADLGLVQKAHRSVTRMQQDRTRIITLCK